MDGDRVGICIRSSQSSGLAWLSRIERAPTTVRAYAHDLKTFWEFVEARGLLWDQVSLEQLGEFIAWLRQPADNVIVLATGRPARAASTVNRVLTAVFGFYEFHGRHGVEVARALVDERRMGSGRLQAVSARDRAVAAARAGRSAAAGAPGP